MHLAARYGNEAVLLAIVNKIGAGLVQIVQNKKSKVITTQIIYQNTLRKRNFFSRKIYFKFKLVLLGFTFRCGSRKFKNK